MTDIQNHSAMPDDDVFAAEYALGVLEGEVRAEAERRIAHDANFAQMVEAWQHRLAPWADDIAAVTPPLQVWNRIAATIPVEKALKSGLWQSLTFWRGLTLVTGAFAAACIGALIYLGNAPSKAPLVAAIDGGGHRHFIATVDIGRGSIAVVPAAYTADATRVPELWLIPPDGKPRALGLLSADHAVTIPISAELVAFTSNASVLAVSLEPPGGSPTGQPTGPVIAQGKLTTL